MPHHFEFFISTHLIKNLLSNTYETIAKYFFVHNLPTFQKLQLTYYGNTWVDLSINRKTCGRPMMNQVDNPWSYLTTIVANEADLCSNQSDYIKISTNQNWGCLFLFNSIASIMGCRLDWYLFLSSSISLSMSTSSEDIRCCNSSYVNDFN